MTIHTATTTKISDRKLSEFDCVEKMKYFFAFLQ